MDLDLSSCWGVSLLELVFGGVGCVDAAVVNGGCDRTGASGMGNGE